MQTTKNNLAEAVRTEMVQLLNTRLADAIDLFDQTPSRSPRSPGMG